MIREYNTAIKTIYQNPSITDQVIIPILTPGADSCFSADPYMVNVVTIYYLQTDFTTGGTTSLTEQVSDPASAANLAAAQQAVCQNPSPDNIAALQTAQQTVSGTVTFYYTEANPIKIIGTPVFPAWLSTTKGMLFWFTIQRMRMATFYTATSSMNGPLISMGSEKEIMSFAGPGHR